MTLQNVFPWILRAQKEGWAVGAFNANTMEQAQAIAMAAQEEKAPAIIQISHRALRYIGSGNEIRGLQYIAAIGKVAADSVIAPISLHLDHGSERDVLQALALGFTSVMFDGDGFPFDENIAITKRLCEAAHSMGACMEAEVGEVPKPDGKELKKSDIELTDPDEAAEFAKATGVDLLAIALGSVHGMKTKDITLDLDRLAEIRKKVGQPLVLHGSSGVSDTDIKKGVSMGLAKVNVATQLAAAFTGGVREVIARDSEVVDPRKYLSAGRDGQMAAVRERIRFLGASGKA
jgi:fructose-bisphosphate aldolase class II